VIEQRGTPAYRRLPGDVIRRCIIVEPNTCSDIIVKKTSVKSRALTRSASAHNTHRRKGTHFVGGLLFAFEVRLIIA
jgi:hypothetical protein